MKFVSDIPKKVLISATVLAASMLFFLILFFTLGNARTTANEEVDSLRAEVQRTEAELQKTKGDFDFVIGGMKRYDALIASDTLVPHTRRAAVTRLQDAGRANGLSTLNFSFGGASQASPQSAALQPKDVGGAYRLNVETVSIALGAPVDGMIYRFVDDVAGNFPGTLVLERIELSRAAIVQDEALNQVARGKEAGLVGGKVDFSWRTAQRNEQATPPGGK